MSLPDLSALAQPGARIAVRATPRAKQDGIEPGEEGAPVKIRVTAPADKGRANAAVTKLLAKAMGVAPSRLTLLRGETARDKLFRLD
ncbi:DUF167 domain-containing protein [Rhodobacter sp. NTK016B]|uniref:DUF167 domain-containing protein n=1 Tax=Rhodobacter sp. NTK016B TaxID=2759676 RepID=UPI001A8C1B1D|nr:DUF167 domain-containing protein [Rhodobacter sp. NTK016B]MBN8290939.1 DUF167 domain-containing protein [Rhodobacter sp. NTK016B]